MTLSCVCFSWNYLRVLIYGADRDSDVALVTTGICTEEAIKAQEREDKGKDDASMLDSVHKGLPAVMEAFQMTTKVSRVGFDWPDADGALVKLDEEAHELREAVRGGTDQKAIAVAAVDRLTDQEALRTVAEKARLSAAARRAKARLQSEAGGGGETRRAIPRVYGPHCAHRRRLIQRPQPTLET